jgi:hypothetical protein
MSITLSQILALVGKLDDTPGEDTARERFRRFLKENVLEVGQIRDHIEDCLRTTGDQYNRALQDLVNYLGHFLEFGVTFGRYSGVSTEVGFDGLWQSPRNVHVVVEVKTTEVYAIKTATLVGYVDRLISEQRIPSWDNALGIYVIGRPDPELRQLENAIIAEKRTHQLRIISVNSLLSLAEMMNEFDVGHDDILAVLKPSGPTIDPVVDLMGRLVSPPSPTHTDIKPPIEPPVGPGPKIEAQTPPETASTYWLTPVKSTEEETAEDCIKNLVGEEKIYAFAERTPGRRHLKLGDWICFYATTKGVVAHARITSKPEKQIHPKVRQAERYPWVFSLDKAKLYLDNPIVIDASLRSDLDAFKNRDPNKNWAWFVQSTCRLTENDFDLLTRR